MEFDMIANDLSDEDSFQVYGDNDISAFEEERCGICMDIVIDRGVLDCCQHWFCFACIDNWATIINLCPLCQTEFQLITCIPVHDTTGINKVEDDSFSRDDDWCIEGKNNSLSFPSYYIDENAVVCLDGDDCKIRSGSKIDDGLNYDTSIACDSCDTWYHAFCVGFDPENTKESTWLCSRCLLCEMPQRPGTTSEQRPQSQCGSANGNGVSSVDASFTGNVSVSVANVGETAVVVSLVGGNQWSQEPKMNFLPQNSEPFIPMSDANSPKVENPEPKMDVQEVEPCLLHDHLTSLSSTLGISELNGNCDEKRVDKQLGFNVVSISSKEPFGQSCIPEISKRDSSRSHSPSLTVSSFVLCDYVKNDGTENETALVVQEPSNETSPLGDYGKNDCTENETAVDVQKHKPSSESSLLAESDLHDVVLGDGGVINLKRKHRKCSEEVLTCSENGEIKANVEAVISAKKVKTKRKSQIYLDQSGKSDSDVSQKCCYPVDVNKEEKETHNLEKEDPTSVVMSIVRDPRPLKLTSSKEREAGLRVKKIIRRVAEDKESSIIVQNLRKEIREAIRNKSSIDFGKKLFDPKLLAAFRTVVAGPVTEPVNQPSNMAVKTKKTVLQKGKARENLTKKIYGVNGRRQGGWDRDCEIEFWKHRCVGTTTKPEKIEILKSVLDLLKMNTENGNIEQQSESHIANPILSRLYLADASVLPRKDNIKPLAALKVNCKAESNEERHTSIENKFLKNQPVTVSGTNNLSSKVGLPIFDKEKKAKVNINKSSGGLSLTGSKVLPQKEPGVKSDDIKCDKRRWALEVLARKTTVSGKNAIEDKHKDSADLKGNYPLLAQLPIEMRPVLVSTRHNKVPISTRQAQLNRLTEHFLRKINQLAIHRTSETELAVADAINIEKEIADKSNSKIVYVNLCSHELLRCSSDSNTDKSIVSIDKSVQGTSIDPDAEEALRNAGLLSDSPPNSPHEQMNNCDENVLTKKIENGTDNSMFEISEKINDGDENDLTEKTEAGPENILEIDSHPDLDIYGDFEYVLEDEDYVGASTINICKTQSEEELSKLKVVFSTLSSDRPNDTLNCEASKEQGSSEVLNNSELKCSSMEDLPGEDSDEPSLAECEELYGPDKEPLVEKFTSLETVENRASNQEIKASEPGSLSNVENCIVVTNDHNGTDGKASSNNSQTSENVRKGNKSNKASSHLGESSSSVSKKVEAYIKEHLRPLCKSGAISVDQYRRAVAKTTEKVMKYHSKEKNACFLIKEGEKVKKLAQQYVEATRQKEK